MSMSSSSSEEEGNVPAGAQRKQARVEQQQQQMVDTHPAPAAVTVTVPPKHAAPKVDYGISNEQFARAEKENHDMELERMRETKMGTRSSRGGGGGGGPGRAEDPDDLAAELIQKYPDVHPALITGFASTGRKRSWIVARCEMIRSANGKGRAATSDLAEKSGGLREIEEKGPPGRGGGVYGRQQQHQYHQEYDPLDQFDRVSTAISKVPAGLQESVMDGFFKMFLVQMMDKQNQPPPWWQQAPQNNGRQERDRDNESDMADMIYNLMMMKIAATFAGDGQEQLTVKTLEDQVKRLLDDKQQTQYMVKLNDLQAKLDAFMSGGGTPGGSVPVGSEGSAGGGNNKIVIDMDNPAAVADFVAHEGKKAWDRFNAVRALGGYPQIDAQRLVTLAESEEYSMEKLEAAAKRLGCKLEKPPTTMEEIQAYVDKRADEMVRVKIDSDKQRREDIKLAMNFATKFADNVMGQLSKGKAQNTGIKLQKFLWDDVGGGGTDPGIGGAQGP